MKIKDLIAIKQMNPSNHLYLKVVGKGENQHLGVCKRNFCGRIWMWLGLSSSSMQKIAKYIVKNKAHFETAEAPELRLLKEKLVRYEAHHRPTKVTSTAWCILQTQENKAARTSSSAPVQPAPRPIIKPPVKDHSPRLSFSPSTQQGTSASQIPQVKETLNVFDADMLSIFHKTLENLGFDLLHHLLLQHFFLKQPTLDPNAGDLKQIRFRYVFPALILKCLNEIENKTTDGSIPNDVLLKIKDINKQLTPIISNFSKQLFYYGITNELDRYANNTLNSLDNLQVGVPLLLPFGSKGHGSLITVEKVDPVFCRVIYYETSAHTSTNPNSCYERDKKFQTFDIMEKVPLESVLKCRNILTQPNTIVSRSSREALSWFRDQLCRGGIRKGPSPHSEDYERSQGALSCSTQCVMAFLRLFIMEHSEGSPAEKEAVYKAFKTSLLLQIYNTLSPHVDIETKHLLSTSLDKLNGELELMQIAKNKQQVKTTLENMAQIFQMLDLHDKTLECEFSEQSTYFGDYAKLRKLSNYIFQLMHEGNINQEMLQFPGTKLSLAKLHQYQTCMKNRVEQLITMPQAEREVLILTHLLSQETRLSCDEFALLLARMPSDKECLGLALRIFQLIDHVSKDPSLPKPDPDFKQRIIEFLKRDGHFKRAAAIHAGC